MPCFRIPVEFGRILRIPVDTERSLVGKPIPIHGVQEKIGPDWEITKRISKRGVLKIY